MADPTASSVLGDGRVSTGNPGLDAMLEGGLIGRRPYLVVGPSGTGKTTLALQFLCEGIRHHERALLVTLEEPPNEARVNHRGLSPELDQVDVFDAIPDIMRYERVPFKDIASVRYSQPFSTVALSIRQSPELSSVEVTLAALEQMLRTEVIRKGYTRVAIDSLTALQYFCMKGFDPVAGAQTFLRFLSDLHVTTILTVESPLEDLETPERALARGEIRLFRWEHENLTVRAVGVEKFRGSSHDVRLHPYRIGSHGLDINLGMTISRDTRQIVEAGPLGLGIATPTPVPIEEVISPVDPLAEEIRDLALVGVDIAPVRGAILEAIESLESEDVDASRNHLARATAMVIDLSGAARPTVEEEARYPPDVADAFARLLQRSESARTGLPPTRLPPPNVLELQLHRLLASFPVPRPAPVVTETAPVETPAPSEPSEEIASPAVPEVGSAPEPAPVAEVEEAPVAAPSAPPAIPDEPPAVPALVTASREPAPASKPTESPARSFPAPPSPPQPARSRYAPPPVPPPSSRSAAARPVAPEVERRPPPEAPPPLPTWGTPAGASPPAPKETHASGVRAPSGAPNPSTLRGPAPGAPAGPPMPSVTAPATGPRSEPTPVSPSGAAAAKRRRKAPATARRKAAPTPVDAGTAPPTAEAEGSEATAKPKKKAPRRRKAPTVVGSMAVPVPAASDPAESEPADPPAASDPKGSE